MINGKRITEDLRQIGLKVNSIDDLINSNISYPEAIPLLTGYLHQLFESDTLLEGVIRALTVKEAKGKVSKDLLDLYDRTPCEDWAVRWAIGNAIGVVMTQNDIDRVIRIVSDNKNGISRQMFVLALGRFKKNEVVERTLINLLEDDEVVIHAINALRKLKSVKAKTRISSLSENSNSVIRALVKEYLEKVG